MSYYGLTEKEYTEFSDKITESQLLDGPHMAIGNFKSSPTKFQFKWNTITNMENDEYWYPLDVPHPRKASVRFAESEIRFFGVGGRSNSRTS